MSTTTPRSKRERARIDRAEAKAAEERRRKLIFAGVGVVVLGVAVLIGVLSAQESSSAVRVDDIAGAPSIDGEPLPPAPDDPTADTATGSQAPLVEGADFDGTPVTLGDAGTPKLVMFLASWCPACQQELPAVVSWADAGGVPDGVELMSVITGLDATRPNWPPDAWVERESWTGANLIDDADGSVAGAYGLTATPYWVALDAEGRVAARVTGMLDAQQLDALASTVAAR